MKLKTLMMGASIAAMMAGGAYAQTADDSMTAEQPMASETEMGTDMTGTTDMNGEVAQAPTFTSLDEMTVGDVVGFVAYDPADNRIGEVDYVVANGESADAVIGIGGFLGLGEYTVALPLADFELREDGMSFVLDTDKETLKEQPEFDESGVEGLPDETPVADLLPADEEAPAADDAMGSDASASADSAMEGEEATEDMAAEAPAEDGDAMDEDVATDTEAMDEDATNDDMAATEEETETESTVQ